MIQKKSIRNSSLIIISLVLSLFFVLGTYYLKSEAISTFDLDISLGSDRLGRYKANNYDAKPVKKEGVKFVLYNISTEYQDEVNKIESITDSDKIKAEDLQQLRYGEIRTRLDKLSEVELKKKFTESYTSEPTDENGITEIKNLPKGVYYIREIGKLSNIEVESLVIKLPIGNDYSKNSKIFPKSTIITNNTRGGGNKYVGEKGGKRFIKTDEGKQFRGLPNAKFIITKKENGKMIKIKRNGKDMVLESDENGRFQVEGLDYGEYYLVETQAPIVNSIVYNILEKPVPFTVDDNSYEENKTLRIVDIEAGITPNKERNNPGEKVPDNNTKTPNKKIPEKEDRNYPNKNKKQITIPKTGDIQIYVYSCLGLVIITVGTLLYKKESKKNKSV